MKITDTVYNKSDEAASLLIFWRESQVIELKEKMKSKRINENLIQAKDLIRARNILTYFDFCVRNVCVKMILSKINEPESSESSKLIPGLPTERCASA